MGTIGQHYFQFVSSVPDGDLDSGRRLHEALESEGSRRTRLACVHSATQFRNVLKAIAEEVRATSLLPTIHFDSHGTRRGLTLASGETIEWAELDSLLVPINFAGGMRLLVVLGSCFGGFFAPEFQENRAAPYRMLIGLAGKEKAGTIHDAFTEFYQGMTDGRNRFEELESRLRAHPFEHPPWICPVEVLFAQLWASVIHRGYFGANQRRWIEKYFTMARFAHGLTLDEMRDARQRMRRDYLASGPQAFERSRRAVFALDRYPELELELERITWGRIKSRVEAQVARDRRRRRRTRRRT